jgi:hypothetical protein
VIGLPEGPGDSYARHRNAAAAVAAAAEVGGGPRTACGPGVVREDKNW